MARSKFGGGASSADPGQNLLNLGAHTLATATSSDPLAFTKHKISLCVSRQDVQLCLSPQAASTETLTGTSFFGIPCTHLCSRALHGVKLTGTQEPPQKSDARGIFEMSPPCCEAHSARCQVGYLQLLAAEPAPLKTAVRSL